MIDSECVSVFGPSGCPLECYTKSSPVYRELVRIRLEYLDKMKALREISGDEAGRLHDSLPDPVMDREAIVFSGGAVPVMS